MDWFNRILIKIRDSYLLWHFKQKFELTESCPQCQSYKTHNHTPWEKDFPEWFCENCFNMWYPYKY